MAWLPDSEKMKILLPVLTECTNVTVTDRQTRTHGHRIMDKAALDAASRGKQEALLWPRGCDSCLSAVNFNITLPQAKSGIRLQICRCVQLNYVISFSV